MRQGEAPADGGVSRRRYEALAAAVDGAVLDVDADGRVTGVGEQFVEQTGYGSEEVVGEPLAALFGDDAGRVERALDDLGSSDATLTVSVESAGGESAPFELQLRRVSTDGGAGAVGVLSPTDTDEPTHGPAERQRVLHDVYDVTTDADRSFEERTRALLSVVRETVGTEYASLSRVEGGDYAFELVDGEGALPVEFGEEFALEETNCERVVETEETVVFRDIAADAQGFEERAANADLGLSCFLGAPVVVDGDVQATFCFLDSAPRPEGFSEWEVTLVGLAAEWVGYELAQRRTRERLERRNDALEASRRRYRTLAQNFPNGGVGVFDDDLRYTLVDGTMWDDLPLDAGDVEGETIWEALPEDAAADLEPVFRGALDGETDSAVSTLGGRTYRVWAVPLRDADGEVTAGQSFAVDVTDQQEREAALANAKEQMEAAAEAGAVGTWEWHVPEDRFVADAALARLFGVDPERAREGVPLSELVASIHEDDRERVAAAIDEAVETCSDYEEEYRVYDADGDVRWVVARGHVECEDGEAVTFPGAITDITEQKRAEREIEQHREQLATLFEVLPVGVIVADADGELVEANGIAKRIWGGADFDAESVEEYDRYTAWWADSGERVESDEYALARVLDGEPVVEPDVYDIEAADGSERVIEVRGMPVYDDGDVARGVITMTDVTERAERDRTLERRAHQQRVVADLGQRALDADDLDELMAQAAEQVADALDNDYCKVLDLDDDARELLLRQGVGWDDGIVGNATVDADDNSQAGYTLVSEEPVVVDNLAAEDRFSGPELLTSHGVESGVSTIIGSPEEPWGILGTHDTSRKQFSAEDVNFVQSVANVLADAIERERYDAEREQLVADLAESNERLEQFAYAASHDLQEPLRMVSSYLSLIEDRYGDALDEDGREFLEYAVDGADRMQEMIDALLEYSRVDRGDSFGRVDLDAVFADVCRDFEVKIDDSDATVVAESLPTVAGDEDQLRQVLGNLLSNAIEYGGEEPTVRVSAERGDGEWVVAVSDDGIGIDPEHADRIFEVFQRLHTHDEHPGTGVGLALVQRIVERHGGDVRVESTPGEGATFYFTIPDRNQRDD